MPLSGDGIYPLTLESLTRTRFQRSGRADRAKEDEIENN
jgi:hypothetical protein